MYVSLVQCPNDVQLQSFSTASISALTYKKNGQHFSASLGLLLEAVPISNQMYIQFLQMLPPCFFSGVSRTYKTLKPIIREVDNETGTSLSLEAVG